MENQKEKARFVSKEEIMKTFPNVEIQNGIIQKMDLNVIGHFGNIVTLNMPISIGGGICDPLSGYNATISCGVYIRTLFELFELSKEDGCRISTISDIPCRIAKNNCKVVAIGHFISDKFIAIDDFPEFYNDFMEKVQK